MQHSADAGAARLTPDRSGASQSTARAGSSPLTLTELEAIVRGLPGALICVDERLRIALISPRALALFGYQAADLIGRPLSVALENFADVNRRGRDGDSGPDREIIHRIGESLRLRVAQPSAVPMHRSVPAEQPGDSIAAVAHDLRNFVTAIGLTIGRIEREPDAARRSELAHLAGESIEGMRRMISDLIDIGCIDGNRLTVKLQPIDPIVLLVEAETLFKATFDERGIAFGIDVPETLPHVSADHDRILQVLANLFSNAVKVTPSGGRVDVSAMQVDDDVVISVRDTGRGIPRAHLAHVFDRYWRAQLGDEPRGTGLGLAIVKGIVRAHGGTVRVTSSEGTGSTFSFSLPLADVSRSD